MGPCPSLEIGLYRCPVFTFLLNLFVGPPLGLLWGILSTLWEMKIFSPLRGRRVSSWEL